MPLPSTRLATLMAVTGLALFAWPGRSWVVLVVAELVILAMFVADVALSVSPKQIKVFREVAPSIALGETTTLTWAVENHSSRPVHVSVVDVLWPSLRATRQGVDVTVAAQSRHIATTELWPSRRGRFPLDEIGLRVQTRWGLGTRQRTDRTATVLRVLPAFGSRDELLRRMRQPRIVDVGMRTLRLKGTGTDFDQLREYQVGDDTRRMDWPATSRLQKPIVRQYRAERNQTVVLLVDNGRVMAGAVAGVDRVEHAMDAALGMTQVATGLGDKVALVTFDRQVRTVVASSAARAQQARVAEALYLLEPDLNESAYHAAFVYAAARFRRRSLYVLFTDLVESVIEESILPALATLSRRHVVMIAAVSDPVLAGWVDDRGDGDLSDAYRQASAIAMVQQRRRSAVRLTAAGALVVDAPPGELAARVVDAYLELKASGRL